MDRGHYIGPAEVVARALELLDLQESWLEQNRQAIADRIDESSAQIERGEGIRGDTARELPRKQRANRG